MSPLAVLVAGHVRHGTYWNCLFGRERMECRPAASSNLGSGEGRAPFALGSEQG